MHLAILHYHLNRGGVTRVIENQLLALDAVLDPGTPWRVTLVYGGRREGRNEALADRLRAIRLSLVEVPGLDYDAQRAAGGDHADKQADDLYAAIASALGRHGFHAGQTVLHVHNHSLGKNRALPRVVPRLAASGYGTLLQIHDFAEDFRPEGFRNLGLSATEMLYPQASNVHYAVLNGRDRAILAAAGTDPTRLHLLPNPVLDVNRLPERSAARTRLHEHFGVAPSDRYLLYPVRCIRRKNVGEALLLGVLAPRGTVVGLTLAPLNPLEQPVYQTWKQTASALRLSCRFEVGAPGALTFIENLAAADAILTTSLAEGFGMVMLESWLAGRPLVGRDLPEITPDFVGRGLRLDWLRPRLLVPVEWIGREGFRRAVAEAYRRALESYGMSPSRDIDAALDAKTENGWVDFGDLDEPWQRRVLEKVLDDPGSRQRVFEGNPGLEESLAVDREGAVVAIEHNARVIHEHFSLVPSGERLLRVYGVVADSPPSGRSYPLAKRQHILDAFLAMDRFRLLRSNPVDPSPEACDGRGIRSC